MKHTKNTIRKKNNKRKTKKIFNMIGCSICGKKHSKNIKCKKMKGGFPVPAGDVSSLAYTGKPFFSVHNPHLAYTGQNTYNFIGGNTYTKPVTQTQTHPQLVGPKPVPGQVDTRNVLPFNGNGGGYKPLINRFPNSLQGGCGLMCGGKKYNKSGGGCGCEMNLQSGGSSGMYPNGLTGSPWTPNGNWPGTNNISGDFNHYKLNTYINDPQTAMGSEGNTNPNYTGMIGKLTLLGGKNKKRKNFSRKMRNKKAGGILPQDLVNLGRNIIYQTQLESNTINGYKPPVNPLPYMDQYGSKYN